MIHKLSDVQTENIGKGTSVWQYTVILKGAVIGDNCNVNCHVFIENDVKIGSYVTIKAGVYLWDGITVEDHVFIGPNVTFVNDKRPRSKQYPNSFQRTIIRNHASLGAASIILGGLEIGEYAMIGAGALITKDVPSRALVVGNPGKIIGWVNEDGSMMVAEGNFLMDDQGKRWHVKDNKLQLI